MFINIIQLQQLVEKKVITVYEAKQLSCPFSKGAVPGSMEHQQQAIQTVDESWSAVYLEI
jgi:hypothetical protein